MEFVHQLVLLFPSELITFRNTFEHLLIFLHHTILLALTENIFNFSEIPLNVFLMHDALAISKFVIPVENSSRYRSALFRYAEVVYELFEFSSFRTSQDSQKINEPNSETVISISYV